MKNLNLFLLAAALSTPCLAQDLRVDGTANIVLTGTAQLNVGGSVTFNAGSVLNAPATTTFKVSGGSQTMNFGGNTLGILQLEGTGIKTLQQDLTCANLVVNNGTTLTLPSGIDLTANTQVSYAGNITLNSGAALVQTTGSTLGTTTGTFLAERGIASKPGPGYNYISSPVVGATFNSIGTTPYPNTLFRHDPTQPTSSTRWVALTGTTVLTAGTGYTFISNTGASILNFTGVPHNATINQPLTGQGTYRFNLVGNPYPSPVLLADLFLANNDAVTGISGTAWFWQDNNNNTGTGNYTALNQVSNPTAQVAIGQGFMVQANSNSGTLSFTNAMRRTGDPVFYRGEGDMERFRLEVTNTSGRDELWVAFGRQFTTGFERGYDAEKLEGAATVSLSAVVGNERLAIAALPDPTGQRFELPLQLFARGAGQYTFTSTDVESPTSQKLFLEDRQTGEFYYLQPGRNHTLNVPAGTHRGRYFLRSSGEVVGQAQTGESARAYSFGSSLFVEVDGAAQVRVFDPLGVEVARFADVQPGSLRRLGVAVPISGVYVIRMVTPANTVEKRVWLDK
jgi:hypothetical protein